MTPQPLQRRSDDMSFFKKHNLLWTFMISIAGVIAYIFTTFATYSWVNDQLNARDQIVSDKLSYIIDKQKEQDQKIEKLIYYFMKKP